MEPLPWWEWRTRRSFDDLCQEAALLTSEPKSGTRLHQWYWRTKQRYAKGELTLEAIKAVESIPWWLWDSQPETNWQDNYETITQLTEPPRHKERPKEYKFVHAQKAARKSGRLSSEQTALLEEISWWHWGTELDAVWQRRFESIVELPEPPRWDDRLKEYRFVHNQKSAYKKGRLPEDRIEYLETISWWQW